MFTRKFSIDSFKIFTAIVGLVSSLHCDISHSAIGIIPMVRNFRSGLENAANLCPLF